jgi:threonine aldolase
MTIDLRSDTFTKPSEEMLKAMSLAPVGDDVFGEDETVNLPEGKMADLFGKEAALFCPSGTMTNQIAIKCHTQPGFEVICEKMSHIYIYEGGGIASNSGCQARLIEGDRGKINANQVLESINSNDIHKPITGLVSIENTCNRGGGSCYHLDDLKQIQQVCVENDLPLHLDGARIWNALIAQKENPRDYGSIFNSISVCLSKGLGAPVGSVLIGDDAFIKKARRIRKVMGGGMRQAGYLAAAGIYAVENNFERLAVDHFHAKEIGQALIKKSFIGKMLPIETNMIIFEVIDTYNAITLAEFFKFHGVLCIPISNTQIRMVTHLDVTESMVQQLIELINKM